MEILRAVLGNATPDLVVDMPHRDKVGAVRNCMKAIEKHQNGLSYIMTGKQAKKGSLGNCCFPQYFKIDS